MSQDLPHLRLGFAGTPEFAVPALAALCETYPICAVFTQPDRPAGRGQPLHASPVKTLAAQRGLHVYQPTTFKSDEAVATLRALELDALIVVAYGLILPPAALQCPRLGCINIHASLLPRWRGAAPIQRAVLAGDSKTGITIMRMEAGLDTGSMLAAREMDIRADDTAKTLHDRLARLGAELIGETLGELHRGRIREVPQPAEGVTYAAKITKAEALIDWQQDAVEVWRRVRAFNPWPIAETRLNGTQLRIWDAELADSTMAGTRGQPVEPGAGTPPGTVLAATHDGIDVACGRGVLRILRLQLPGRKPLVPREFIQGQRLDGARFAPA
ncbi:MAG: methionyl-tRNA formyltransferase [Gammaproteobacteria bacterium]|nr:methionyl-tRNA formyltransferase [Gammaproteobacteria bacterium]